MVRLISRQRGGLAALKLTKLFGIDDFPAAKDSGKVLIIIIYCYLIIIIIVNATDGIFQIFRTWNKFRSKSKEISMLFTSCTIRALGYECHTSDVSRALALGV